jgi:hypothetical protein
MQAIGAQFQETGFTMNALGNAGFLKLWENGVRLHPLDRGLLAIRALLPPEGKERVADWSLGRRNQALARLHQECFGSDLRGWMKCAQCGEKLEFALDTRALIQRQRDADPEPIVFKDHAFRLPTSRDLALIAVESDSEAAALRLAGLCRIEDTASPARNNASPVGEWTGKDIEQLAAKMSEADPLAEISLFFECPTCKSQSEESLDLAAYFWAELEAFARRLLYEVHLLASSYGWSEDEILSLSDNRRAIYLQMVQA